MGGEDWEMWIDALKVENLLAPERLLLLILTSDRHWLRLYIEKVPLVELKTISTATITDSLASIGGKAYVSVNKALVTQASSAIPVIPLYISLLYK
jgi:enoyl-[acyl-carrier protein] reductase/trans-2-enoyl-CoA reductase (NAD+)